jgi:hypothetical protein
MAKRSAIRWNWAIHLAPWGTSEILRFISLRAKTAEVV